MIKSSATPESRINITFKDVLMCITGYNNLPQDIFGERELVRDWDQDIIEKYSDEDDSENK